MNCFIHQSHGRVRIRVPSLRDASQRGEALVKALARLRGVRKISLSEVTGSVVIYYDPNRQNMGAILKVFRAHHLLENVYGLPRSARPLPLAKKQPRTPSELLNASFQHAGRAILVNLVETTLQRTGQILLRKIFS